MAREYARIRTSIADDPDLEELSLEAQWLYFRVILPDPTLSSVGVMDWRPRKLIRKASNSSFDVILGAAAELERARFLLFDLETEEVLVRTYVRNDELLRNPKMAGSVIKAFGAVASKELRAAVVTEIARVRADHPDFSSWTHKDTAAGLSRILSRPDAQVVGYTDAFGSLNTNRIANRIGNPNQVPITNPDPVEIGDPDPVENAYPDPVEIAYDHPEPDNQSQSVDYLPATAPSAISQHQEGGYVTGERHQGAAPERIAPTPNQIPSTPYCTQHPGGTPDPCRACADTRRRYDASEAARLEAETARRRADARAQSEAAQQRAADRRAAIAACGMCGPDGYRDGAVCDHDPGTEDRARRGMAAVRAALAQKAAQRAETDSPTPGVAEPPESPPTGTPATETTDQEPAHA
jgi:hypothetical protein